MTRTVEIEQIRNACMGFVWIIIGVIVLLFGSFLNSVGSMPLAIYAIMDCLYVLGILFILYGILGLGSIFTIREKQKST